MKQLFENWQFQGTRLCKAIKKWDEAGFVLDSNEHKEVMKALEQVKEAAEIKKKQPWYRRLLTPPDAKGGGE